jgi:hypothetical protein
VACVAVINDSIHVYGGENGQGSLGALDVHERFDPVFFSIAPVVPGAGNAVNTLSVTGATPRRNVRFYWSLQQGSTGVTGCGGVSLGLAQGNFLTMVASDVNGSASVAVYAPAAATGRTILFQALDENGCGVSEVMAQTFQ